MNKLIIYITTVTLLSSCKTYKMLEGKSSPVYFSADPSVFNDKAFTKQFIYYTDLLGLTQNFVRTVELTINETNQAIVHEPTFFSINDPFLVYPSEHIIVKKGVYNDFTFEVNGNKQRNMELQFFSTFNKLYKYPAASYRNNAPLDTILIMEEGLKSRMPEFTKEYQQLFDSLINANELSSKFKKIASDYMAHKLIDYLFLQVYRPYKDTLHAHNLYKEKCKQLILSYNAITNKNQFAYVTTSFNEIVDAILPYSIWGIKNDKEFQANFDSIETNFKALPKDYLLSQLMYYAYKKRIQIPLAYVHNYDVNCTDVGYKKIIQTIAEEQKLNDEKANKLTSNSLLSFSGKKVKSLETTLEQYKGKLVFIDFWASWCSPCLNEVPAMKKIIQAYKDKEIVFLSISLDREVQPWRKKVISLNFELDKNFLLINPDKSSFVENYSIQEIPRFMLFGKDGRLIDARAPRPSEESLKVLLDKLLSE